MLELSTLLRINLTTLLSPDLVVINTSLPSRCPAEEHIFDLFQCLAGSFREEEESVSGHGETEDAEDEVGLPFDVDEGGWGEVAKCEVKDPVGGCGDGDSFASYAEGEEFGWVDPAGKLLAYFNDGKNG